MTQIKITKEQRAEFLKKAFPEGVPEYFKTKKKSIGQMTIDEFFQYIKRRIFS